MKKVFKFLKISFKLNKSFIFLVILKSLFFSCKTLLLVYTPKIIIDSLSKYTLKEVYMIVVILMILNFITYFLEEALNNLLSNSSRKINSSYHLLLTEKILTMPYSYIEDPYYLDLKERALFATDNQNAIVRLGTSFGELFQGIINIITLAFILSSLGVTIILVVLVFVLCNSLLGFLSSVYTRKLFQEVIPINRKFGYYFNSALNSNNNKDIKLYSIEELSSSRIAEFSNQTYLFFKKVMFKLSIFRGLFSLLTNLQNAFVYFYVSKKLIDDRLRTYTIGSFSLYVSSAIEFSKSISLIINQIIQVNEVASYLNPFFELLDIKEEGFSSTRSIDTIDSIEFINVSFKYPKAKDFVLKNISFKIKSEEKISIVGLNGAGKTTLVKLLCRLYRPTEGQILINGYDIFDYDIDKYNKVIACVFQDYKLLPISIKDNIVASTNNYNIEELLDKVGLTPVIENLKNKEDSILSKTIEEGGIELSGGEKQKIAIARAIHKNASLIILDEPTSALDPIHEAQIYEQFNDMVTNKTAIYISHKMSSSVFCDKVLVIEEGIIKDYDTHINLMKNKDSLYYKLFSTQAKYYKLD